MIEEVRSVVCVVMFEEVLGDLETRERVEARQRLIAAIGTK